MKGFLVTWPQLLFIGLVLVVFYAAEVLLFLRKANASQRLVQQIQIRADVMATEMKVLRQELELLKVRLAASNVQQAWVAEHQNAAADIVDSSVSDPSLPETPYAHAIRMVRTGADPAIVAQECGISRGEADLIVALYRAEGLH